MENISLHPQFLMAGKQPTYAVLPIQEYKDLLQALEDFEDNRAFEEAMQAVHSGEESYPSEVVYDLLDGKNPLQFGGLIVS